MKSADSSACWRHPSSFFVNQILRQPDFFDQIYHVDQIFFSFPFLGGSESELGGGVGGGGFGPILTPLQVAQKRKDFLAGVVIPPSDVLLLLRDASKAPQEAATPPPGRLQASFKTLKDQLPIAHICKTGFHFAV